MRKEDLDARVFGKLRLERDKCSRTIQLIIADLERIAAAQDGLTKEDAAGEKAKRLRRELEVNIKRQNTFNYILATCLGEPEEVPGFKEAAGALHLSLFFAKSPLSGSGIDLERIDKRFRKPGRLKGRIKVVDNLDAPPEDLAVQPNYMEKEIRTLAEEVMMVDSVEGWLITPNLALGYRKPIDAMKTEEGAHLVIIETVEARLRQQVRTTELFSIGWRVI